MPRDEERKKDIIRKQSTIVVHIMKDTGLQRHQRQGYIYHRLHPLRHCLPIPEDYQSHHTHLPHGRDKVAIKI
jgi:hypothetical protein